jgi:hypothetical protein
VKANLEIKIKEAKLGVGPDNLPSQNLHANRVYLLCTLLAFNLLAWLKLLALPQLHEAPPLHRRRRHRRLLRAGSGSGQGNSG